MKYPQQSEFNFDAAFPVTREVLLKAIMNYAQERSNLDWCIEESKSDSEALYYARIDFEQAQDLLQKTLDVLYT